mmetsp:Transcript_87099/g.281225  ORF Transcript_87099/g.281225 Transcript_87099/m.281225 type:complete len:666 (+) Transcript_87099:636-2633(+)
MDMALSARCCATFTSSSAFFRASSAFFSAAAPASSVRLSATGAAEASAWALERSSWACFKSDCSLLFSFSMAAMLLFSSSIFLSRSCFRESARLSVESFSAISPWSADFSFASCSTLAVASAAVRCNSSLRAFKACMPCASCPRCLSSSWARSRRAVSSFCWACHFAASSRNFRSSVTSLASKRITTSSCKRFHSSHAASSSRRFRCQSSSFWRRTSNSRVRGSASAFSVSRSFLKASSSASVVWIFAERLRCSSSKRPNWPSLVTARCSFFTSACNFSTSRCSPSNLRCSSETSPRKLRASLSRRARSDSSSCRRCSSCSRTRAKSESKLSNSSGSTTPPSPFKARASKCSWYFFVSRDRISERFSSCSNLFFSVSTSSTLSARALSASNAKSLTLGRSSFASFSSVSWRILMVPNSVMVRPWSCTTRLYFLSHSSAPMRAPSASRRARCTSSSVREVASCATSCARSTSAASLPKEPWRSMTSRESSWTCASDACACCRSLAASSSSIPLCRRACSASPRRATTSSCLPFSSVSCERLSNFQVSTSFCAACSRSSENFSFCSKRAKSGLFAQEPPGCAAFSFRALISSLHWASVASSITPAALRLAATSLASSASFRLAARAAPTASRRCSRSSCRWCAVAIFSLRRCSSLLKEASTLRFNSL